MNDASRTRANITGTIFGVLFGIGNVLPGVIGSVPGCGCCLNYFVWVAALFFGGFAGLFAAVFADWVKFPYDRGLGIGGLLGLRAGALAGLLGGLVFQVVPTLMQMTAFMFPGANDVTQEQAASGATGMMIMVATGALVNLALVPACSGLCGAFWGFVVGAIRRRQDAKADEVTPRPVRLGYFSIVYGSAWALMVLLTIGYGIIMVTRPGGGIASAPDVGASGPMLDTSDAEGGTPAEVPTDQRPDAPVSPEVWPDVQCAPAAFAASRELRVTARETYPIANAFDGTNDTAWSVRDVVPGQDWVEITLAPGTRVSRLWLTTGYDKTARAGDLFSLNAHLHRFTVVTDAGSQSVEVGSTERFSDVRLSTATGRIRIVMDEVWPGERWQDLCLSEIRIYCAEGTASAAPPGAVAPSDPVSPRAAHPHTPRPHGHAGSGLVEESDLGF